MIEHEAQRLSLELGFDLFGIVQANHPLLDQAILRYDEWLRSGRAANMQYLERHREKKREPHKLFAAAKSVICVALNYGNVGSTLGDRPKISRYTQGDDYHQIMLGKLEQLQLALSDRFKIRSHPFVDSSPVLERFWAWQAGLGWIGKNSMIINRRMGSYFFLGGLFVDVELTATTPATDHCGKCRKCIEACPTSAILEQRQIDSNLCIGYHTIENKEAVPKSLMGKFSEWIAGCDICQEVCPWNDPLVPAKNFLNTNPLTQMTYEALTELNELEFKTHTKNVAMGRMKYSSFLRNLAIAIANSNLVHESKIRLLEKLRPKIAKIENGARRLSTQEAVEWALEQVMKCRQ